MSAMSESAEVNFSQNASNSDLVENQVITAANGDPNGVPLIRPDVDNSIESKTIECGDNSESERNTATTVKTRVTQLNGMEGVNGMRSTDADPTQTPDVCSGSQHIDHGVDGMREEPSPDLKTSLTSAAIPKSDNEVIIIETVVKSDSNEVTLITDTTIKTTVNSTNHNSNENSSGSSSDSKSESIINNNNNVDKNNSNKLNNKSNDKNCGAMTTTTSRPKQLKGLLKKPKEKSIKTNGEKRRVTFSETMQVFCDDWPQNLMPQIIALKSPTDFNLVEVQGYMFEPPVEYQDFLPFDPPPDYRDFIANSLCAFDRDLSINYIDEEEDEDSFLKSNYKSEQKLINEFNSKWESMILNNNESLEEEQIIGVLKEDAILQAIGSHISLPEENLCPEDFPIHFPNKTSETNVKLAESELSDITSDDGNDSHSSPTGSLQDIQSDSSITSQDTIILINTDSNENNDNIEFFSNKSLFKEINAKNSEDINNSTNSESVDNCQTISEDKSDSFNDSSQRAINSENTEHFDCEESKVSDSVRGTAEDAVTSPDVTHNVRQNAVKRNESHENDSNNESKSSDPQLNSEEKQIHSFTDGERHELPSNHSHSFRRNLQFYENMFSNNSPKSDDNPKEDKPMKQRVSHFFIQNNPKYPIITQTIGTNVSENNRQISESSIEVKQMPTEVSNNKTSNVENSQQTVTNRAPQPAQQTSQTQPNTNNWSADEFIIEYTSEPKALVPSKRTSSLSNFATAQMSINPHILRNNPNVNNIQYLSLSRNGETPKQWNAYNIDSHNNSSQMHYPNPNPPNQRSISPNPPMSSAPIRPVSPQQSVFFQNRPQYSPRYPPTHTMPVHVMYNRISGPQPIQQRVSLRLPIMSQTLGPPHKKPPPYHYHIQQHTNDFPNPSEIRRRDGLNAYPHVMNQTPAPGALPVPPIHHNNVNQNVPQNASPQTMTKDELEQFVQQDIQRTERIKKRYSMSEEDDPSFGFARRPSVRGIRPKFESTNEILKQMQTPNTNNAINSQVGGSHMSWPQNNYSNNSNNNLNNQTNQQNQSLEKRPHIVQIRFQPQNPMSVKYANESPDSTQSQAQHNNHITGPQMSRTLPRPSSLISQSQMNAIRSEDGFVIRLPANVSRDQLKQQIQRQIEQQFQSKLKQKNSSSMPSNAKPMMSSNDERGAPEGASSSPKHSSDLLFAKNLSSNSSQKSGETTANKQQTTNDTKKLVINPENNTNSETNDRQQGQGVIYYAMNV